MHRSPFPRRPGDVRRTPQRSCTHKASSSSEGEAERERESEREQYRQAKTHRHNNYTYTASRHIMRQCRGNFKEKHRYMKNNTEQGRERGNRG